MATNRTKARVARYSEEFSLGDTAYLVRYKNLMTGEIVFMVQSEPPMTKKTREVRIYGWLGTTNNVSANALGKVRLIKWVEGCDEVHFDIAE